MFYRKKLDNIAMVLIEINKTLTSLNNNIVYLFEDTDKTPTVRQIGFVQEPYSTEDDDNENNNIIN